MLQDGYNAIEIDVRSLPKCGWAFLLGGKMLDHPCLLCKPGQQETPSEEAHWPLSRRYGTATIPMCRKHHDALHWGRVETVERVIDRAPGYWRAVGEWEANADCYEAWCGKRRYLKAVRA